MKQIYSRHFFRTGKNRSYQFLFFLCLVSGVFARLHAQVTYTFTTAGATGSAGPTQAQLNTSYTLTNLSGLVTSANGIQTWTVPASGLYRVDITGSAGGSSSVSPFNSGGYGSHMAGDFSFSINDVIRIVVGQKGLNGTTGSGGGGTYVTRNNVLIIAAGGGGGGTSNQLGANSVTVTSGTNDNPGGPSAGGINGNGGQVCNTGVNNASAGGGYLTDGASGTNLSGGIVTGGLAFLNGSGGGVGPLNGGFGGGGAAPTLNYSGGGGGGGYSGGAGGQQTGNCMTVINRSGGGGGGSFNTGANQNNTGGVQTGDGNAIITSLCNINVGATATSICSGAAVTITTNAVSNYSWSTGSTASSITVSPAVTTTYTFSGTSATSCNAMVAITITVSTGTPTLSIVSSTPSTCFGNTVSITASGALTYTYSGGISSGVSFTPALGANNYTITGGNGCGTTTSVTTITVAQLPVGVSATSTLVCAGTAATLSASGAASYTWMPGAVSSTNNIVNPLASTVYTITGKTGSCTGVSTFTVNTKPNPTLTIVPSATAICIGSPVTLTVTGNAATYTWSLGGSNLLSVTDTPTNITLYTVTGTNTFSCVSNAQQVIIVNPLPVVSASASNDLVCSGGGSTLSATGASTYVWTGGSVAATSTMVVNPLTDATYTVTGTSALNCNASAVITVNVYAPAIIVTSGTAICQGANASIGAGAADTWAWSSGQTSQNITVSPTLTTVYTVTADINNLNGLSCPATNTVQVTVNSKPLITVTSNYSVVCVGNSAVLSAAGAGTSGTYTWTGGAGSVVSPNNTVTPIGDQTYTVNATDANGCTGKATYALLVSPCVGISTQAANAIGITIYPNPSNGEFTITSSQAITLHILNELGQLVKTVALGKNNHDAKVANLANGIYFITGENENGRVKEKIIVAK